MSWWKSRGWCKGLPFSLLASWLGTVAHLGSPHPTPHILLGPCLRDLKVWKGEMGIAFLARPTLTHEHMALGTCRHWLIRVLSPRSPKPPWSSHPLSHQSSSSVVGEFHLCWGYWKTVHCKKRDLALCPAHGKQSINVNINIITTSLSSILLSGSYMRERFG